jgi:adenylate kinase
VHLVGEEQRSGSSHPVRLVLLGPPGAGKGTQAERLSGRLDVPHISTGDLFRAHLRDRTALGLEVQKYMDAGELVPDDVTVAMVRERLTAGPDRGFLLDGFPRNVEQARSLASTLGTTGCTLDAVVEFVVPEPVLVQRLLGRGRTDDTEAVIRRRLEVYRQETAPLLHFYRAQLVSIDAVGDVEGITKRVLDALQASTTDI